MKRVLITGATGLVGRGLTTALAQDGVLVRAAARRPSAVSAGQNIEPVLLPDLGQPIDWRPLLHEVEAIVHLAGLAHVSEAIPEQQYDRINRLATKSLALAASLTPGVRRFVFVSSIRAQTGPSADRVLTEADIPEPTDAYGRSKLAAEAFVRGYGVPATILRPVVIYGRDAGANVGQLLRIASLPIPLPLADFTAKRSLLALDNMISAIRFVLSNPGTCGETYIVADATAVSLAEMIAILRRAHGRASGLFKLPPSLIRAGLTIAGREALWERMAASLQANASKLRTAGWTPVTDTPEALAQVARA